MKVLVVSHMYPWPGGERHLFVHQQTLALTERGVLARVISPTPWAPRILWSSPRQRLRGEKPRAAVRDRIPAEYPRVLQPPRRILYDRLGDLAYPRVRCLPSLRSAGYDLIHAHQALPNGALAQRLARDLDVPYVVTVHGADVYQNLRDGGVVARRTAAVLSSAAAVMANSSAVAGLLRDVVPAGRLHVVLNGTTGLGEAVAPADDFLPGEPLVLTVGYLIPRKEQGTVLEALALLADGGGPRPHWAVVGEGPLQAQLAARAAELGLADHVHFLGRQPHERVLALMKRAQLFALPSRDEAFGLVYTEAMAQGTPVLAGAGEGPEDFVHEGITGYLAPVGDAAAAAAVMRRLFADPAAAARVAEAGRAAAHSLTWQRNAGLTLAVYEEALTHYRRKDRV